MKESEQLEARNGRLPENIISKPHVHSMTPINSDEVVIEGRAAKDSHHDRAILHRLIAPSSDDRKTQLGALPRKDGDAEEDMKGKKKERKNQKRELEKPHRTPAKVSRMASRNIPSVQNRGSTLRHDLYSRLLHALPPPTPTREYLCLCCRKTGHKMNDCPHPDFSHSIAITSGQQKALSELVHDSAAGAQHKCDRCQTLDILGALVYPRNTIEGTDRWRDYSYESFIELNS